MCDQRSAWVNRADRHGESAGHRTLGVITVYDMGTRARWGWVVGVGRIVSGVALASGCGGGGTHPAPFCTEGTYQACTTPDNRAGFAPCLATGAFGTCDPSLADNDAGVRDARGSD